MRYRSNQLVPKKQMALLFEKDALETPILRSVQNELQDRAQHELWHNLPAKKLAQGASCRTEMKDSVLKAC